MTIAVTAAAETATCVTKPRCGFDTTRSLNFIIVIPALLDKRGFFCSTCNKFA
jgi:hypothetical protein